MDTELPSMQRLDKGTNSSWLPEQSDFYFSFFFLLLLNCAEPVCPEASGRGEAAALGPDRYYFWLQWWAVQVASQRSDPHTHGSGRPTQLRRLLWSWQWGGWEDCGQEGDGLGRCSSMALCSRTSVNPRPGGLWPHSLLMAPPLFHWAPQSRVPVLRMLEAVCENCRLDQLQVSSILRTNREATGNIILSPGYHISYTRLCPCPGLSLKCPPIS